MSLRIFALLFVAVFVLSACTPVSQNTDLLGSQPPSPLQPTDLLEKIDIRTFSPQARDVSAITAGNVRGAGVEIIALAGEEIFVIGKVNGAWQLNYKTQVKRYIASIVVRDLTGDGKDELIMAGATTPRWEGEVDGWLGVYTFADGELTLLAELSTDTMPLWSCATKNTGLYGDAILASNGHNLYVFSLVENDLTRTAVLPDFAGAVATAQSEEKQGLMAWRSEDGHSFGLFAWDEQGLSELWSINGDRWASTIPSLGDLSGNGAYTGAFQGRDGALRLYNLDGSPCTVPKKLEPVLAEPERLAPPVLLDITGDKRAELLLGARTNVVIYKWDSK